MITETDLRRALIANAENAPGLDDIRTAIRAHNAAPLSRQSARSARPLFAVVAAGAMVAAIILGVVLVVGPNHQHGRRPAIGASTGLTLEYSFRVKPIAGYLELDRDLRTDRQSVMFGTKVAGYSGTYVESARVDVYGPGQFDATAATRGTAISVGGRSGYYATIEIPAPNLAPGSTETVPAIVWEYAPNAWAVAAGLNPAEQTQSHELTFAAAIVPGANPVLLPATLTTLPAGLIRDSVSVQMFGYGPANTADTATNTTVSIGFRLASTASSAEDDYTVSMAVVGPTELPQTPPAVSTPVPAPTDFVSQGSVEAAGLDYTVSASHFPGGNSMLIQAATSRLSLSISWSDQLSSTPDLRWADFTPAASFDDTSTWFPATIAIP